MFITGVRARGCTAAAAFFYGLPEMPVQGITMKDIIVEMGDGYVEEAGMMANSPDLRRAGIFMRNAVDVDLRGVEVHGVEGDWLLADDSVKLV